MFYRVLDKDLRLLLSVPQFADELFALTDRNRVHLRNWLPWLDTVRRPADTRAFINLQLERFARGEAVHQCISWQGRIVGVAAFNRIDPETGTGHIGYWLSEEYTGRGIMTRTVRDLIDQGFFSWRLRKVRISCAVGNSKSRAIPERLGFEREGVVQRAENLYGREVDHVIYGLKAGTI